MHELSIAYNIVTTVEDVAHDANISKVDVVHLRLGALAGVVKDALLFGFDIATKGTCLAGATLEIEDVPLMVYCPICNAEKTLDSIQIFRCPTCNTLTGDIRQGKELEIVSLEGIDHEPAHS